MTGCDPVPRRWTDDRHLCVVAASGPSLTPDRAGLTVGHDVIAVNDAWRLVSHAVALYACDKRWWIHHRGVPEYGGEKWSCDGRGGNDKKGLARQYGLHLVTGCDRNGFSLDPEVIHYGRNSGFQAINLAILFGARRIVLIGFDMRIAKGRRHFFGDHPAPLRNARDYGGFVAPFERAARHLPPEIEILNATPGSALKCFPAVDLREVLA